MFSTVSKFVVYCSSQMLVLLYSCFISVLHTLKIHKCPYKSDMKVSSRKAYCFLSIPLLFNLDAVKEERINILIFGA